MRHVIMALDMIDVHDLGDSGMLIEVHEIALHTSIIGDAADVTFEMSVIDRIKTNEGAGKLSNLFPRCGCQKDSDWRRDALLIDPALRISGGRRCRKLVVA